MKKIVFSILVLFMVFCHAQDSIIKNVHSFDELKVFDKIQVTLIQSKENKVEILGIKRREVNVLQDGNLLKIRMSLDNLWDANNTRVIVYYKEIQKIDANEGASVIGNDIIRSNNLDLRTQEGASISAKVEGEFMTVKAITGGKIELEGVVQNQQVNITSGGQYYASNVKTKETQVKISAGGTAEIHAREYVKANTNAGGIIRIFGNPKEMDTQKFLGGKIIEVN
ncbi:head GIN domain-containing protein [Aquimarina pacifica]|uniref:head GIN domain-containing protein n=1 Tax=Aquimarina pacifica TaxID=1296415 RepID=UPI0004700112|nr:head GIN domain-containing protein [Aquimarina pacifica]